MNVFESLIEELKEENLLEETVMEAVDENAAVSGLPKNENPADCLDDEIIEFAEAAPDEFGEAANAAEPTIDAPTAVAAEGEDLQSAPIHSSDDAPKLEDFVPQQPQPGSEAEFYRKRANSEVAFLQMVESAFAGVERDQMKIVPKPYDNLEVKKVLHSFLQVSGNVNSPEHSQAEFQLMQETESWYSALSHRDKRISVAHLRRYCENSRPPLSTPALVALARFYRNAPYSAPVRNKFDLIITRLFARDVGGARRDLSVNRDEIAKNLQKLYSDWSSVSLYSTDENDSQLLLTALKYEDFMAEADAAACFDELIKNDFFNRLRAFKEEANENFYAPLIAATAVECNVRVGNRYVELLEAEKKKNSDLEDKYGFLHDQAISEAVSKTLQVADLANSRDKEPAVVEPEKSEAAAESPKVESAAKKTEKKTANPLFKVNKWLLALTIFTALASGLLYYWANSEVVEVKTDGVQTVNLDGSILKEHLKIARINGETLVGVVLPAWEHLTPEKKAAIIKEIGSFGGAKGYKTVHLINDAGETVGGFANGEAFVRETN